MREKSFTDLYDERVTVTGHVAKQSWKMKKAQGCLLPSSIEYSIRINEHGHQKVNFDNYLVIKKSTIGTDENVAVKDEELFRQSGLGLFADRDFEAGDYIGPYIGELKEMKTGMYLSSYSLNMGDGKTVVDAKGGLWNPIYYGMHFINDSRDGEYNVTVDKDLRVFASKKIKVGDELFISYGRTYWRRMNNEI